MEKKYKKYYMHTINGRPAFYTGEQICYSGKKIKIPNYLCVSLKQIREEQKNSEEWRKEQGYTSHPEDYGYTIIWVVTQ